MEGIHILIRGMVKHKSARMLFGLKVWRGVVGSEGWGADTSCPRRAVLQDALP